MTKKLKNKKTERPKKDRNDNWGKLEKIAGFLAEVFKKEDEFFAKNKGVVKTSSLPSAKDK